MRDSTVALDEILECYNHYIVALAQRSLLWRALPPERLPTAIDELAQNARLKLWQAMQKRSIEHHKSYIRRLIEHEAIDILRHERSFVRLDVNEEGEVYQDHFLATPAGDRSDSLERIEHEEAIADLVARAVGMILGLPPRQQRALICSLKDRGEDALPLLNALQERGIAIGSINWPEDEADRHRLKASLAAARKKLRSLLDRTGPVDFQGGGR